MGVGILKILASNHRIANLDLDVDYISIRNSDFRNGTLTNCVFGETTRIVSGKFGGTTLENCKLRGIFSSCYFDTAFWDMVDARDSYFEDCLFINVDFKYCNLRRMRFNGCIFHECSFCDCDISRAQFSSFCSIVESEFIRCDFERIQLPEVFVPRAIANSKNVPYIPMVCPDEGDIMGYKKAWAVDDGLRYPVLVTLYIPADARRSSGSGRKCRCDKATVMKMEWVEPEAHSDPHIPMARSIFDEHFIYTEGKEVKPRNGFCEDRWDVCSGGIHFFMNKQEAIDY